MTIRNSSRPIFARCTNSRRGSAGASRGETAVLSKHSTAQTRARGDFRENGFARNVGGSACTAFAFAADTDGGEGPLGGGDKTVANKSRSEGRIRVPLNPGLCEYPAYPPGEHAGMIVLRVKRQDEPSVLTHVRRLATALARRNPTGERWIVDGNRVRFRQGG
jgi:hypothetical protein